MTLYFEDVKVGAQVETPGRTITEADLVAFAGISGEHEALDFSQCESGLRPLVPDLLVMTLTSGLGFRVPAPQPRILAFMTFDWKRLAAVRVGDTVHCRLRVTGKRPFRDGGVVVEKREMINQRGEVVQEAEYKFMVARRPPEVRPA